MSNKNGLRYNIDKPKKKRKKIIYIRFRYIFDTWKRFVQCQCLHEQCGDARAGDGGQNTSDISKVRCFDISKLSIRYPTLHTLDTINTRYIPAYYTYDAHVLCIVRCLDPSLASLFLLVVCPQRQRCARSYRALLAFDKSLVSFATHLWGSHLVKRYGTFGCW